MAENATEEQVDGVSVTARALGLEPEVVSGGRTTTLLLAGNGSPVEPARLELLPGVARVVDGTQPFKKVSWAFRDAPTVVALPNGTRIGGSELAVIARPASVDCRTRVSETAHALRAAGVAVLHGGVHQPHGSPYARRSEGRLEFLARAREDTGMALVVEAQDIEAARVVVAYVDVLQIGPDNMQNFSLLRVAGELGKPVMLTRGPASTIDEMLLAAEYLLAAGNENVILCEAGVLGLSADERRLLDLTAIPLIKSLSHLPVVIAASRLGRQPAIAMGLAAAAAGADGMIVEIGTASGPASDEEAPLDAEGVRALMRRLRPVARAMGRGLAAAA